MFPQYEIKKWRRINHTTFVGELWYKGKYDCDCTLATVSLLEYSGHFILEASGVKYILYKTQEIV